MRPLKRLLFGALGVYDWARFNGFNSITFEGREHLQGLPKTGVLFVSNHLTYYIDVLAIHQAIASPKCVPWDGFRANLDVGFVAASETLNNRGLVPKLFNYTGAVPIRRTWREGDRDVQRAVDPGDVDRIATALRKGWLITFPQGTTAPGAPVRKGTAHIILEHDPLVVPVRLAGFDQAFSKKGLRRTARGVDLSVRFDAPRRLARNSSVDDVVQHLTSFLLP